MRFVFLFFCVFFLILCLFWISFLLSLKWIGIDIWLIFLKLFVWNWWTVKYQYFSFFLSLPLVCGSLRVPLLSIVLFFIYLSLAFTVCLHVIYLFFQRCFFIFLFFSCVWCLIINFCWLFIVDKSHYLSKWYLCHIVDTIITILVWRYFCRNYSQSHIVSAKQQNGWKH